MRLLIRDIRLHAPGTADHGKTRSLRMSDGQIEVIAAKLEPQKGEEVWEMKGATCSAGWMDLRAFLGEPGHEHRETIQSGLNCAARGGFTEVCALPNTTPPIEGKDRVGYLIAASRDHAVALHPLAALSKELKGHALTEFLDEAGAGAVGFTDGWLSSEHTEVLRLALDYSQHTGALVMQFPQDAGLSELGQMHEGVVSTRLGLKGIPSLAEELMVARDLELLAYTGGKLLLGPLSAKGSVERIRAAKKAGLKVFASVSAAHLAYTDEALSDFDVNLKLSPPLRAETDRQALWKGVADGTIDAIVSDHRPVEIEGKLVEFDGADPGMTGLETVFALLVAHAPKNVSLDAILDRLTTGPRQLLGQAVPELKVGVRPNLTLFNPDEEWVYDRSLSRSKNTPLLGQTLKGKVLGIVRGTQHRRFA